MDRHAGAVRQVITSGHKDQKRTEGRPNSPVMDDQRL